MFETVVESMKGKVSAKTMIRVINDPAEERIGRQIFEELYNDDVAMEWTKCAMISLYKNGWSGEKASLLRTLETMGREQCEAYQLTYRERRLLREIFGPDAFWHAKARRYADLEGCSVAEYNGIVATNRALEYVNLGRS